VVWSIVYSIFAPHTEPGGGVDDFLSVLGNRVRADEIIGFSKVCGSCLVVNVGDSCRVDSPRSYGQTPDE
jgi:hypothetical protein